MALMPKGRRNALQGHRIPTGARAAAEILCLRGEEMPEKGIESRLERGWMEEFYA